MVASKDFRSCSFKGHACYECVYKAVDINSVSISSMSKFLTRMPSAHETSHIHFYADTMKIKLKYLANL